MSSRASGFLFPQKQANIRFVVVAAILAGTPLLFGPGCRAKSDADTASPTRRAVRVDRVTVRDLQQRVDYLGTVRSTDEVRLLAQVPGTVRQLAQEGDAVEHGSPVVWLSAPETLARVDRVEAELARAVSERDFLCKNLETDEALAEAGALSQAQLDASRRACTSASAAANAAQASTNEIQSAAQRRTERAPFTGRVLQWLVEPGQSVMPGQPLVRFGAESLEIEVAAMQSDVQRGIAIGTPAMVTIGEQEHRLSVTEMAPVALGAARSVMTRVAVPNELSTGLRHGMALRVALVLTETPATASVPMQALARGPDSARPVFAVGPDGKITRHDVAAGIHDRGYVGISPALPTDTLVATSDLEALRDGTLVLAIQSKESQP